MNWPEAIVTISAMICFVEVIKIITKSINRRR